MFTTIFFNILLSVSAIRRPMVIRNKCFYSRSHFCFCCVDNSAIIISSRIIEEEHNTNTTELSAWIRHPVVIGNECSRFCFCFRFCSADSSTIIISSRIIEEEFNNIIDINLLSQGYWQQTLPFLLLLPFCR